MNELVDITMCQRPNISGLLSHLDATVSFKLLSGLRRALNKGGPLLGKPSLMGTPWVALEMASRCYPCKVM